jgi:hypothetical protein
MLILEPEVIRVRLGFAREQTIDDFFRSIV